MDGSNEIIDLPNFEDIKSVLTELDQQEDDAVYWDPDADVESEHEPT